VVGLARVIQRRPHSRPAYEVPSLSKLTVKQLTTRSGGVPLFWQIFAPNAIVLLVAIAILAVSPATVSSPATATELLTIVGGLAAMLLVNFVLFRRAVGPLESLSDVMRRVDPLLPGQRVSVETRSSEMNELRAVFNDMLERLEDERRQSGRRLLTAQEEERRRLARELHDELNQTIAGVMLSLREVAGQADGPIVEELKRAQEELRALSVEVEHIVGRLRPETLDDLGLLSSLVVLIDSFTARTGIDVERRFDDRLPQFDSETELVIYRIAQEGLTNVAVHASATKVVLALDRVADVVRLSVADNGIGMNGSSEGNGIRGMRERALLVSAKLEIESSRASGTEVRLQIPTGLQA
jgi:two-component system, NarL family, sensor histidine kinase UhpB